MTRTARRTRQAGLRPVPRREFKNAARFGKDALAGARAHSRCGRAGRCGSFRGPRSITEDARIMSPARAMLWKNGVFAGCRKRADPASSLDRGRAWQRPDAILKQGWQQYLRFGRAGIRGGLPEFAAPRRRIAQNPQCRSGRAKRPNCCLTARKPGHNPRCMGFCAARTWNLSSEQGILQAQPPVAEQEWAQFLQAAPAKRIAIMAGFDFFPCGRLIRMAGSAKCLCLLPARQGH